MKILFTASQRGKEFFESQYKIINQAVEKLGHTNVSDDLLNTSKNKFYDELQKGGREANVELYKIKMKNLQEADICLFECSTHSLSIGFIIQKALELNKPTIVLYYEENIPHFIVGVQDEKLIIRSYNEKNIETVLKEAIEEASELRDKRFNFFISPRLLAYLEQTSNEMGITKSTFIRNLIQEHMKKHK